MQNISYIINTCNLLVIQPYPKSPLKDSVAFGPLINRINWVLFEVDSPIIPCNLMIHQLNPLQLESNFALEQRDQSDSRCGLYITTPEIKSFFASALVSVPLKTIAYHIEVVNNLAKITLTQLYQNTSELFLETKYSFPIDPKVVIHQFRAKFGDSVLSGIVREKEQAKREYTEALREGREVTYGEIDDFSYDILNLKIGNIPPKTQVTIQIQLIQELEVEINTFYKLTILSKVSPRYLNSNHSDKQWLANISSQHPSYQHNLTYTWDFSLKLRSQSPLTFNNSSSHELLQTSFNVTKTEADFILDQKQNPIRDFIFIYSNEAMMACTLGINDANVSAAISFIPRYAELRPDDAFMMMMKNQPLEIDVGKATGQYIFLLDRSWSMGGGRIKKAFQALKFFIKSLPPKSIFNIVSFGGSYLPMFPESVPYNDINLKHALQKLSTYGADLGGTQIQEPLNYIFSQRINQKYLRQTFILTDGGVTDTNKIISLVEGNVQYTCVHTIGIGDGCSAALIKGCAQKGRGKAVFIRDQEDVTAQVIRLLNQSLSPVVTSFSLDFDLSVIESIAPNPNHIPFVLLNDPVNFYIIFKPGFNGRTTFKLKYSESVHNALYQNTIVVDTQSDVLTFPFVDKIAHHKTISVMVDKLNSKKPLQEGILIAKGTDLTRTIIEESVKHQVLCPLTAYICVGNKLEDGRHVEYLSEMQSYQSLASQIRYGQQKLRGSGAGDIGLLINEIGQFQRRLQLLKQENQSLRGQLQDYKSKVGGWDQQPIPSDSLNSVCNSLDDLNSLKNQLIKSLAENTVLASRIRQNQEKLRLSGRRHHKELPNQLNSGQQRRYPPFCGTSLQCSPQNLRYSRPSEDEQLNSKKPLPLSRGSYKRAINPEVIQFKSPIQKHAAQISTRSLDTQSTIDAVLNSQKFDGHWDCEPHLVSRLFPNMEDQFMKFAEQYDPDFVITLVIVEWLEKNHNSPAHLLIIKKARSWIVRQTIDRNYEQESISRIRAIKIQ